ncbi:MAG: ATP-binding protein [Nitrospirae bacterium]|nr:ATP-binding protein [Nitrospirota bacterium]
MKVYITALMVSITLSLLVVTLVVSHVWLKNFLREETRSQLSWQMENTKNNVEYFVKVKLSALKYISSQYSSEELLNHETLYKCFTAFKRDFGDVVDLGVIDADGVMRSYVGPYNLSGNDYSNHEWFQKTVVEDTYVSDVFTGYRAIPHFAIAVKKPSPNGKGFIVIRATIDMATLQNLITAVRLKEKDDVFIISQKGVMQTPSRIYGSVLGKYPMAVPVNQPGVNIMDLDQPYGSGGIRGYAYIKNTPWILVAVIMSRADAIIGRIFLKELLSVFILSLLIIFAATIRMAHVMVNWIKEADRKRENALTEIEHSSKLASIGRLAAGVAHEINNPLSIINQNAGLIKDILEMSCESMNVEKFHAFIGEMKNKDKFIQLSNGILDAVNRCRTITHRLLGFARRMDVTYELIDLNETIIEVIGFLEKETIFRSIQLVKDFAPNLPAITTDKGQLQQVLLNLVNNAIDAVDRGGSIEVSTKQKNDTTVVIIIRDDGPGIDPDILDHIFEPFFTTKERGKGTGLGLSISYGIIKKLSGIINVESTPRKGTVFTVELPVKDAQHYKERPNGANYGSG